MDGKERALPLSLLQAKPTLVPAQAELVAIPPSRSDEELLERIRDRDETSALTLFRRYDKLAYSVGYRILHDQGEAEDFVQEIFLRLCSEVGTFDRTKGSARIWIIQMIYRRAFDRRAYLRRRHFYNGTDSDERTNTHIGVRSHEDEMIDRLTARQLKTAFSELSDRQRATLEAFFFEGLSFAEIAERSGEEITNIRHHYYRGLEGLRQLVREMMRTRKLKR